MSLMMPDGKSWTTSMPMPNQFSQPSQKPPGNGAYNTTTPQQQTQQPSSPKSMDFSAYAPSKAQSIPSQSTGSPYSPQSNQALVWNQAEQAYLPPPQQPAEKLPENWDYRPFSQQPQQQAQQPSPATQNTSPSQQPAQAPMASMQPGVYYQGQYYGGDQSQGLAQAQRLRDALVVQTLQADLPYRMANVFGKDLGAPNYDFQGMLGRANQMVQDGFYNPFTQYLGQSQTSPPNTIGQYAPPSPYGEQGVGPVGAGPQIPYQTSAYPPGVKSPWMNDPNSPLPPGWQWQKHGEGTRSEGWMSVPVEYSSSGGAQGLPYTPQPRLAPEAEPLSADRLTRIPPNWYYNDKGKSFLGTQSYAPGTTQQQQDESYRQFAKGQGYYRPGQAQPKQEPSAGTPYQPVLKAPATTPKPTPAPTPLGSRQSPKDSAAIERARQYNASNVAAFKKQYAANIRARRPATAGMPQDLVQWAQQTIQDGDPTMSAYADDLSGPGTVSRLFAAGKIR